MAATASINISNGGRQGGFLPRPLLRPFLIVLAAALICSLVALFCLYPQLLPSTSQLSPDGSGSLLDRFACFKFITRSKITDDSDQEDFEPEVDDQGEPYNLFGTKTTYLNAREAIRKAFIEQQTKTKKAKSKTKKTKKGEQFWSTKWKSNPNNDGHDNCSPTYFYFLNRHSIRYPSVKEIRRFRELLPSIREQLLTGGRLSQATFRSLLSWRLLMSEVDENHVSQSGRLETAVTGKWILLSF